MHRICCTLWHRLENKWGKIYKNNQLSCHWKYNLRLDELYRYSGKDIKVGSKLNNRNLSC